MRSNRHKFFELVRTAAAQETPAPSGVKYRLMLASGREGSAATRIVCDRAHTRDEGLTSKSDSRRARVPAPDAPPTRLRLQTRHKANLRPLGGQKDFIPRWWPPGMWTLLVSPRSTRQEKQRILAPRRLVWVRIVAVAGLRGGPPAQLITLSDQPWRRVGSQGTG